MHVWIHHVHHSVDYSSADLEGEDRFRDGSEADPNCFGNWHAVFGFLTCPRISEQKSTHYLRRRLLDVSPDFPVEPSSVEKGVVTTMVVKCSPLLFDDAKCREFPY